MKLRLPARDPRTVARDIPGIFDALFPQLAPGVVAHFNGTAYPCAGVDAISPALINASSLQHAMLFELGVAAAEQSIVGLEIDWDSALQKAISRQRRHFDAKTPENITPSDIAAAGAVAENLSRILAKVFDDGLISIGPSIAGFQWIAQGNGDFSVDGSLIEVKCSAGRFGAADYRQLLMYWLLSYAASVEGVGEEWIDGFLINPRRNAIVYVDFDMFIRVTAAGRSKVEILELFSAMIGDHVLRISG